MTHPCQISFPSVQRVALAGWKSSNYPLSYQNTSVCPLSILSVMTRGIHTLTQKNYWFTCIGSSVSFACMLLFCI